MDFKVTKSTVELYKFRHESGCYWADITIDACGTTGRINISSDYGNWSNYWGACGCPFKQFLSQIGYDYAASKFGVEEWVDVDGTLRFYKELLVSYRRDETLAAEEARDIYNEINSLRSENRHTLVQEVTGSAYLMKFLNRMCGMPEFIYMPSPQFKDFWKNIWPALLAEFKREAALVPAE
ncbi:hypothetical protein DNI29_19035 [Hymenobacter sediminis]|uniref:hypothetical protein n=1 Tax=Hymenobacter sediminis TaxID=2218621 RepID=UPI000DA6A255|nr:hypothetical protein [Hymenobacter sediminis]RPD45477.1 hypothetical protein DNI29_19035 [Hymenobacter sediminis]